MLSWPDTPLLRWFIFWLIWLMTSTTPWEVRSCEPWLDHEFNNVQLCLDKIARARLDHEFNQCPIVLG